MPMPRWWARANRVGLNRLTRHIAWWMPGLGLIEHTGRRTGHTYFTPVNVFRRHGGYVVALPYGSHADWVRNVLAAGKCRIRTRGHWLVMTPRLVHDETGHRIPAIGRLLRLTGVHDYLELDAAPNQS